MQDYRTAIPSNDTVNLTPQDYQQENLDLFADNVKDDRIADDLLTQVMLDWGLPLSLKIEQETIQDQQVFKVEQNFLFACFDRGVDEDFTKEIAKEMPLRIVFRDNYFKDDTAKRKCKAIAETIES